MVWKKENGLWSSWRSTVKFHNRADTSKPVKPNKTGVIAAGVYYVPNGSRLRLLLTDAGSVMLGEARRTLAGEATDGVNAQELTVMLFG